MPAHVLNLFLQLSHCPRFGALEDHVLQEVRGPVGLIGLEAAPGVDPHADRGGAGVTSRVGGEAEPVGEGGDAGLRGGQDGGMVGKGGVGGGVAEESGVGVIEALDLGSDGLGEAIVEHHGGFGQGGSDGGGVCEGGNCRGGGKSAGEEEGAAREGEKLAQRHC
ncbi:unnamed protein product [Musa acuminata subsp. burmannicoides]